MTSAASTVSTGRLCAVAASATSVARSRRVICACVFGALAGGRLVGVSVGGLVPYPTNTCNPKLKNQTSACACKARVASSSSYSSSFRYTQQQSASKSRQTIVSSRGARAPCRRDRTITAGTGEMSSVQRDDEDTVCLIEYDRPDPPPVSYEMPSGTVRCLGTYSDTSTSEAVLANFRRLVRRRLDGDKGWLVGATIMQYVPRTGSWCAARVKEWLRDDVYRGSQCWQMAPKGRT